MTKPPECIIFSMNRAMQLHALLSSYKEKVFDPSPIHVIYKATTKEHEKAYKELFQTTSLPDIKSIYKERDSDNFKTTVLNTLSKIESEKMFFLVDDDLFIEDVHLSDISKFNNDLFVPSLRMGEHITICYTAGNEPEPPPKFLENLISDKDKICWHWKDGIHDWKFPMSLTSHIFSTKEITYLTKKIAFNNPNLYEARLNKKKSWKPWFFQRICKKCINPKYISFKNRYGVAYKKSKIVNIPCNKVQQSQFNNVCGDIHQDDLLTKWNAGLQINYQKLYGTNNISAHQELPLEYISRKN